VKLLSGTDFLFSAKVTLTLNTDLDSNPKLPLDISYQQTKSGINRPKKTQVIEQKLIYFIYCNSDIDLYHRLLGTNFKLPLDISYLNT